MTRTLKSLVLVVVALAAFAAVGAATASAEEFHSETENTTLTGTQVENHKMTFAAGTLKCKASFEGLVESKTSESFELTPTYSECTLAGVAAVFDRNGCTLKFTTFGFFFDIKCPAGKKFEITAPGCTIDIPSQGPISTWSFVPIGSPPLVALKILIALSKIKYSQTGKACPGNLGAEEKTFENGTYNGEFTMIGENSGKQVGIWIE